MSKVDRKSTKLAGIFKKILLLHSKLVLLILPLLSPLSAIAQEAEEAEEAAASSSSLWEQLVGAGIWMLPLVIASLALIALYVYNFIQLSGKKFNPPELKAELYDHMQDCRVRSALEIASQNPSFLGRMLTSALPKIDATDPETLGRVEFQDECADFSMRESREYMTWIGYMGLIAQAAPMLGLLGTVAGMIGAFSTLGQTGQADPSQLAGDISTALITTASGLVIAIPSIFGFNFFKNKLSKAISEAQTTADELHSVSVTTVNAEQILAKVPEGVQV